MSRRMDPLCAGMDDNTFFPEKKAGPANAEYRAAVEYARSLCDRCPVRVRCLAQAIRNREEHGIWGGLLPEERNVLVSNLKEHM